MQQKYNIFSSPHGNMCQDLLMLFRQYAALKRTLEITTGITFVLFCKRYPITPHKGVGPARYPGDTCVYEFVVRSGG